MTLHPQVRNNFVIGAAALALAVLIGAFGDHGLKNMVSPEDLVTFETGVRYHFYHGFGLLMVALARQLFPGMKLNLAYYSFLVGILLFSFNCYLYVLTGLKPFAMIVPLGGLMFVIGWGAFALGALKLR